METHEKVAFLKTIFYRLHLLIAIHHTNLPFGFVKTFLGFPRKIYFVSIPVSSKIVNEQFFANVSLIYWKIYFSFLIDTIPVNKNSKKSKGNLKTSIQIEFLLCIQNPFGNNLKRIPTNPLYISSTWMFLPACGRLAFDMT